MKSRTVRWLKHIVGVQVQSKMWHRLHRLSVRLGVGALFYLFSMRILVLICGLDWLQRYVFSRQVAILQHFVVPSNLSVGEWGMMKRQFLVYEYLRNCRYEDALNRLTVDELRQFITVEGWAILEKALEAGSGVLLVAGHYGLTRILIVYLEKLGFEILVIPNRKVRAKGYSRKRTGTISVVSSAQDIYIAHDALQEGKIVLILPDGQRGQIYSSSPFLDRTREFKTGFAELALMSNAVIIPGEVRLGARVADMHKLYIELSPSFNVHREFSQKSVPMLIEQYARHLEKIWRTRPSSVHSNQMRWYLYEQQRYASHMDGESLLINTEVLS